MILDFNPQAVLFDLDGTLVDTAPDLTRALNHILSRLDRRLLDMADVRYLVGRGARVMIAEGLAATGAALAADEIDRLMADFLDFYGENLAVESKPEAGAIALLDGLKAHGIPMAICSNKPEGLTVALLDQLDLLGYFGAVLGGDSLAVRKPDPEHVIAAARALGVDPLEAVMIGDTDTDFYAAKAAGIPVILVRDGYSRVPVDNLGADRVIDSLSELVPPAV